MTTALLLVDYQVGLCEPGPLARLPALADQVAERDVLTRAANLLDAARRARDVFVVHVRLAFDPTFELRTNRSPRFDAYPTDGAMTRDSPEARIVERLRPATGEPVLDKGCVDPFVGTPLLPVLHARGVRDVLIGGVATNVAVESAARHGTDAGLQVTVVEDLCASFAADAHEFAVTRILPMFAAVRSSAQVMGALR